MTASVLLAVTAAFLFAAGSNLQRHAAARVPHAGYGPVRLIRRLLRSRRWLTGWACAGAGLVLQMRALAAGGLILVQAVIASALVFSLVVEALTERRRPSAGQLGGAALIVAGITLVIRVGRPSAGESLASLWWVAPIWLIVALLTCGALWRARHRPAGRRTAVALGGAAGACFALGAVFLRDLAAALSLFAPGRALLDVAGLALASVVGNLAMQRGFQLAPLRHVLPALATVEPIAAFGCGWILFAERLQGGWVGVVAVIAGLGLMVAGVFTCARPANGRCPARATG